MQLSRSEFAAISSVSLDSIRTFRGRSLLIGITPSGTPTTALARLAKHLTDHGGEVVLETVAASLPVPFGDYHLSGEGPIRIDTRLDFDIRLAELAAGWASEATASQPVPA
jgi:hypothetical protein